MSRYASSGYNELSSDKQFATEIQSRILKGTAVFEGAGSVNFKALYLGQIVLYLTKTLSSLAAIYAQTGTSRRV